MRYAETYAFGGMRLISDPNMTITRPHILFSEERLARVTGGRWWLKTETLPRPDLLRAGDMLIGRPATIVKLRERLSDPTHGRRE